MDGKENKGCPESGATLLLYLFGEAPNTMSFEAHLETCEECSQLLAQHRATLEKYRDLPAGADYFDLQKAVQLVERRTEFGWLGGMFREEGMLRPALAFAVAAALVLAFVAPMRSFYGPGQYNIAKQVDEPLEWMETTLGDIYPANGELTNGEESNSEPLSELDGMLAELEDIEQDILAF